MRNRALKGLFCAVVGLFLSVCQVAYADSIEFSTMEYVEESNSYILIKCHTDGVYPDAECSPGAVFPGCTTDQMCVKGYSATVRIVPKSLKDKVYEDYGIAQEDRGNYVIDHIISLQLCGSNEYENLFPQRRQPYPNSKDKDKIESYLKREVCKGEMDLNEAQEIIRNDWLSVFVQRLESKDRCQI